MLESGAAKLTGREIPATLHDSLMARLDRLGPAKEVAQVASVIGREFSYAHASILFDKFHVMRHLGKALDQGEERERWVDDAVLPSALNRHRRT